VTNSVEFSVSRLTAWAPGVETDAEWREWARGSRSIGPDGEPRLKQMPAMLRRHAGRLGRMVCDVAYRVLDGARDIPIVLCSRYGEAARSVDLLSALATGADLSPTSFGLSVHNANGGLFAMARRDTANCVAIAGGDESAECGIMECCALVADGAATVLLIVADCPIPAEYERYADVTPAAFAWGCLVHPARGDAISLSWGAAPVNEVREMQMPAALSTLRFMLGASQTHRHDARDLRWDWSRNV
jgi:hypothetical protein